MKITPEDIKQLKKNEYFVFGSNSSGIHGGGAARLAHLSFGAKWGVGEGLTGSCYALPTKDKHVQTLPISEIQKYVKKFIEFASDNLDKEFLVTKIGCGLAGYEIKDIAPLFSVLPIPSNVSLPVEFWSYIS